MNNNIFVQIASYRDPELIPTIKDCIAKAKNPERLTFGICWQRDETENLDEFKDDPRFQIIDIPWNKSNGLCWARSLIQKLWTNEKYTIQLDSHHRFLQDWDEHLINMMKLTGSKKPIITSYAGMYSPKENKLLNTEPYKMVANKFTDQGTILFYPNTIPNWEKITKPIPARFVSGHFYFTLGIHCNEYKYDPNIYFAGDEISLSIRSFTLGYDLFHPHYTVIWHEYTREGRTKHWTDFNQEQKKLGNINKTWCEMDYSSKRRLRHMLQEEDNNIDLGEYGLGSVRTHHDYELYAGINFKHRRLHPKSKQGIDPPINDISEWYNEIEKEYSYKFQVPYTEDFKFIYIGVEDIDGELLFRRDLLSYESTVDIHLVTDKVPYKWIYWVVNTQDEWVNRQDFKL